MSKAAIFFGFLLAVSGVRFLVDLVFKKRKMRRKL